MKLVKRRKHICRLLLSLTLFIVSCVTVSAQMVSGYVKDSLTNEAVSYMAVYYDGTSVGTMTDDNGYFSLKAQPNQNELTFAAVGYRTKKVAIVAGREQTLNVIVTPDNITLTEVVIKPKREKYSKKNNPAVELMRKVIAHKNLQDLSSNEYYQYDVYQKMTSSINDITPDMFDKGIFKKMPFLVDQVQPSPETNNMILPLSVQETATKIIYRKEPESKKTIIEGATSSGIDKLFSTGDNLGAALKDVFTDINIYDNDIDLMHLRFVSPLSSTSAISFYKFYIMDTVMVDGQQCIDLSFVPHNSQDFGFTGHIFVLNDSTYAVKRCTMNLPKNTGVNFVESLSVTQEFLQLPNGQWVIKNDDMIVELYVVKALQGFMVRRQTKYENYSFDPINPRLFKLKGDVVRMNDYSMKDDEFWAEKRQVPLTKQESTLDLFIKKLTAIPGVNWIVFIAKAFIENFVELSWDGKPSKFDIGPINTMFTSNYVDGFRLRLSGQTTGQLNPHLFLSGYVAYGFKDEKFKYMAKAEYSFDKKKFLAREYPKHSIAVSYQYDVMSPMDKFLSTDKDNVFVSLKASTVDQMSYVRAIRVVYEREFLSGFSFKLSADHKKDTPTGNLFYIPNTLANDPANAIKSITTAEFGVNLRYAPGETFINTKQRRRPLNLDAPVFTLSHQVGIKGFLGGDFNYNYTEAGIFKRFWLKSWGKVDINVKGGIQWNKVPFPLLIMPEANQSFVTQKNTFSLINNMEFLNDRFVSLMIDYDMGGKFFNRIPGLRRLKWREAFGFKMLYGKLSDKNNPYKNTDDPSIFRFPERNGEPTSFVMGNKPYMEFYVGIHNIFKLVHIDYVRRINYLGNPDVNKHGVRLMVMLLF